MSYVVEVSKAAKIRQTQKSTKECEIVVRVGVAFADKQLTKKGWFVDSNSVQAAVDAQVTHLMSSPWDALFDFNPTFELVSKWLCDQLKPTVKQLEYVELDNKTLGTVTQYIP